MAVCCSVLQRGADKLTVTKQQIICVAVCFAVCCNVLQCVAVCCSVLFCSVLRALQCVAVCCSVLQCVLQCVAVCSVCCSVLQCVAVCCSVLQYTRHEISERLSSTGIRGIHIARPFHSLHHGALGRLYLPWPHAQLTQTFFITEVTASCLCHLCIHEYVCMFTSKYIFRYAPVTASCLCPLGHAECLRK